MDYSLLLAIHKLEETGRPRVKRSLSEPSTDNVVKPDSPSGFLPASPDDTQIPSSGQQETTVSSPGETFDYYHNLFITDTQYI